MSASDLFPVPPAWAARTQVTAETYSGLRDRARTDPDAFFAQAAQRLDWIKPFTKVSDVSFDVKDFHISWFEDGVLNVCANCVDRHLPHRAHGSRSSGRATILAPRRKSPMANCTLMSAASPMCSKSMAQRRATGSRSICP